MPYFFRGFFAPHVEGLMEAAEKRWPGADVSRIREPFDGIGLRLPDADPADPSQYIMVVECQDELPAWTRLFPDISFVYINADCHGGDCLYTGYVCRNGEKVAEERLRVQDVFSNPGALTRLLSFLGANLAHDEYFRPFARDYPWRTANGYPNITQLRAGRTFGTIVQGGIRDDHYAAPGNGSAS